MSSPELYAKGVLVWIPDDNEVWVSAVVMRAYTDGDNCLHLEREDGQVLEYAVAPPHTPLPFLRNPDFLVGENDLTSLSYLHEPAVLYNLRLRFLDAGSIYTYCGIVLVALNPYEELPIYGDDMILAYSQEGSGDMDPHVFAVAQEAFTQMARDERNQSIIVSGESGAGKTVSAKYAMRYFAVVGGSTGNTNVEEKVLASNPIMEAIGNAKTIRNDNSSRFGKYIEIGFSSSYHIVGASMRTYLLEKTRVVFQAEQERNYHVFYQLCACADHPQYDDLMLGGAEDFLYTNHGTTMIDSVNDGEEFEKTCKAFSLLGIDAAHQRSLFKILSAVLHLGNVRIASNDKDGDNSFVNRADPHLKAFSHLLGLERDQMAQWLCHRKICTTSETYVKPMLCTEALNARNALAKHMYTCLFKWIISRINRALRSVGKEHSSIGVLDIYGFETFEMNSFEQFCINYANEKLQQQFNLHVFKLEQEEYMREEIPWTLIDFYDNQPCIDLIEGHLGVLDLLDEDCRMPKGTDQSWALKLYEHHQNSSEHFEKPRMSNLAFVIIHFADKVEYQCEGFLEKNKDTVYQEPINILKASESEFVAELFQEGKVEGLASHHAPRMTIRSAHPPIRASKREHKKTVGLQFRNSLRMLMETLNGTTPHYIRCINPNDDKLSFKFDSVRAAQQLRACGVLETIRISAAGFPSRWMYQEFYDRYRILLKSIYVVPGNIKLTVQNVLEDLIKKPDRFQFGKTKILFRAGEVAFLERLRSECLNAACVTVQRHVRGWLQRRRYINLRRVTINLQCLIRGKRARRQAQLLRELHGAIRIQAAYRMHMARQHFLTLRKATITIQSFTRGMFARCYYREMLCEQKSIMIQRWVRGWLARQQYLRVRTAVVFLQCCVRRMLARRELRKLRIEARSVEHFKQLNSGMENKIVQLQLKVTEQIRENHLLAGRMVTKETAMNAEMQRLHAELEGMQQVLCKAQATEHLAEEALNLREELEKTETNWQAEREGAQRYKEETDKMVARLLEQTTLLRKENEELNHLLEDKEKQHHELMAMRLAEETRKLQHDLQEERSRHQGLLREFSRLEQRHENLREEMDFVKTGSRTGHIRSGSNVSSVESESAYSSHWTSEIDLSDWNRQQEIQEVEFEKAALEMPIVQRLRNYVRDLEMQLATIKSAGEDVDSHSAGQLPGHHLEMTEYEALKLQDLQMANQQLKQDLENLRISLADSSSTENQLQIAPGSQPYQTVLAQLKVAMEELDIRREEVVKLKAQLMTNAHQQDTAMDIVLQSIDDLDGEEDLRNAYIKAYEANSLMRSQLESMVHQHELQVDLLRREAQALQVENRLPGQSQIDQADGSLEQEIGRLTSVNLNLQEKIEFQEKLVRKLKKQVKIFNRKNKELEGAVSVSSAGTTPAKCALPSHDVVQQAAIQRKDKRFQGMLTYKAEFESHLINNLIIDLNTSELPDGLIPALPAYILFMCVRYGDYTNDESRVHSLLNASITGIKKVLKKNSSFETRSFWLANTCRLLHCFKQYSGDQEFLHPNVESQQDFSLRNFDLSDYWNVLETLAVQIYQQLTKMIEETLQPLIVPGMLENESFSSVCSTKPSGARRRTMSKSDLDSPAFTLSSILRCLTTFCDTMAEHGMDPDVLGQTLRQAFYTLSAVTLNSLLLRRDLCSWNKGIQIRYNISQLEEWLHKRRLQHSGLKATLEPLIEVSQILQLKKSTEKDADTICTFCSALTTTQIVKILHLYTPLNDGEERVKVTFIRMIEARMKDRGNSTQLLMDTKWTYPVEFPFNPSPVCLETIQIPRSLNLTFLSRV
uniref:Methyl-CpG binding domain protein 3b n=1 Tax=Eptatretus burgeri TaxID=7764 RepID=A0A8C4R4P1_EPTBU